MPEYEERDPGTGVVNAEPTASRGPRYPGWLDRVSGIFDSAGVPVRIWFPIMWAESSGNPRALAEVRNPRPGDSPERSLGLFQLNQTGGQGTGYSDDILYDPVQNATIGARAIAAAYRQCGDDIACVAARSGHPGPVPASDYRISHISGLYNRFRDAANQGIGAAWAAAGGGPGDGAGTGGTPGLAGLDPSGDPVAAGPGGTGTGATAGVAGLDPLGVGAIMTRVKFFLDMIQINFKRALVHGAAFTLGVGLIFVGILALAAQSKVGRAVGGLALDAAQVAAAAA